jgi:nucleoside 2-deoxyribosyltransferase
MNGKAIGTITPDGLKSDIPGPALVDRDLKCVQEADLIIANLDTFGETRPLIGTIYELAWAWSMEKPVIVISKEDNYKYHSFIVDTASIIVPTVEEMLEKKYVNYMYKGQVSAIY